MISNNFNSGLAGWTTTNNSTGATPADAAWTLRQEGYTYSANVFSSNDDSQFILSNSDDQGSGGTTETILTSPAFSTVGYTALNVNFFHFYRFNSGAERGRVEVSTDNVTWTQVQQYGATTGSLTAFAAASVGINSVAGQPSVRVRFRYSATFDWWWAIDNVSVTGTGPLTYAWTSTPSGFNSTAQNPTGVVVNQNTTYDLTVTAVNGCTAAASTAVATQAPHVVTVTADGPTSFCAPGSVGLSSSAGTTYLWSPGGATTQSIAASNSGIYTVATTIGVCTITSTPLSVTAGTAPVLSNVTAAPSVLCEGGNSQLNVTSNMTYCASTHSSGCGSNDAVVLVEMEDISNSSTCSGGYSDYTAITAELLAGNIYSADITMGSDATQHAAVWIDWNADGDFYEANEFLGSSANVGANGTATFNIEVPVDAANGRIRMRVIGGNNSAILMSQSCGASSSAVGETEDYSVNITGGAGTGITYLWSPGGSLDDATSATPVAVDLNTLPITYTVTVTSSIGCTGQSTVTITEDMTDTDNDGITDCNDNCVNVPGVIGSNCDAQVGPGFVLGQLNNSCQCIQIPCTENVVLELRTDANSDEAGWEILDQNTNLVICSGGAPADPFPNGITSPITPECCLPVGCYRLRVLDSGGDGFVSGGVTGGYQLREQGVNGRRIIDNFGNFTGGGTSAIGNALDNGAFCVPVGNDRPIFSSCDKLDWVPNQFIVATENTNVSSNTNQPTTTGYEFWFFDPNGSYSFRRFRSHATSDGFGSGATRACHMKINSWSNTVHTPHIPANLLLNVRIRGRVNGNPEPFGPACLFKIDATRAACPIVKLQDNPLNVPDFSCGVVKVFGGPNSSANKITANPPQFAPAAPAGQIRYQFRFRITGENICIVRPTQTSPTLHLNWSGSGQLECSKTYEVDVRVSKDGGATWCVADGEPTCGLNLTPWGKVCAVTISTSTFCPGDLVGGSSNLAQMVGNGELTVYPNPNHGEQVFINLSAVEQEVNTISVDIYDLTGKRVIAKTVAVSDGMVNTALELNGDLNSGVYLVNITAGTKTYTQRLVIQK